MNPQLEFAMRTDKGLIRSHNEDAIASSASHGFAIVADGMGGYNAGEVASRIAVEVLTKSLERGVDQQRAMTLGLRHGAQIHQLVIEAVYSANDAILQAATEEPAYKGMGTTLVLAVFHRNCVTIAHVGDSRAYRLRRGELIRLTRDHTLLQQQLEVGLINEETARQSLYRHLVTRAVGIDSELEVELHDHDVEADDIYLLCSDGLSDMLVDKQVKEILMRHVSLDSASNALVDEANAYGGRDNISVVLAKIQGGSPKRGYVTGILDWLYRTLSISRLRM